MSLTQIGNVLLVLGAIPATSAAVLYGFGVTWWRSSWGRHVVVYMASLALVFDLGVIRLLGGERPGFPALRVAAFSLVVVALWWRLFVVVQAYLEGPPDDAKPIPNPSPKE